MLCPVGEPVNVTNHTIIAVSNAEIAAQPSWFLGTVRFGTMGAQRAGNQRQATNEKDEHN